jgi:hypothetical protein
MFVVPESCPGAPMQLIYLSSLLLPLPAIREDWTHGCGNKIKYQGSLSIERGERKRRPDGRGDTVTLTTGA